MVDLIHGLSCGGGARATSTRAREAIAAAGRDPGEVEILAAVKYLPAEELPALADGGVTVVGENRAQELAAKADAAPGRFTWDFIGQLQSRKVKDILPHVRYIHSVASRLGAGPARAPRQPRHRGPDRGQRGRRGGKERRSRPDDLPAFLERCPVSVVGLMTMPPFTADPEDSRPHFAALRRLAEAHGLRHLSMGTSQDYVVAAQEGATIVRLGTSLFRDDG